MSKKTMPRSVIIIGAGVGGVATAARLAKAGLTVTVIEKNDFLGGRCSLINSHGYRFDQGPSLLLLPRLFEEIYRDLGTSLEGEGIELVKCEPNYKLHYGDGETVRLSTDISIMKSEIEKWEGKGGFERYLSFLQEAHRHYELSVAHVLRRNFTSLFSMTRPSFVKHLFKLHPFESIYRRASQYFLTERLRRAFTFGSMYMGMSPFDAPGTYSLLQYTELAEGIWYPIGGFNKIVQGLVAIGKRLGVRYRLSTPVSRIILSSDRHRATGVELHDGSILSADIVICNADLVYAYNHLLPPTPYATSLSRRLTSCSSLSFYWALSAKIQELEAHNIFLADNYRASFDSIFKDHLIPDEPSFYVNVPSRVDASAAPPNKDAVVVLVPVGHLLPPNAASENTTGMSGDIPHEDRQDWPSIRAKAREQVIATMQQRIGVDLDPLIVHENVNDPQSWKDIFNLDRGAILGLSHSFFNVLSFRPPTRHANVKCLYFVGASTHPGTGVPICLAGSKIVADQVIEDLNIQSREGLQQLAMPTKKKTQLESLDVFQKRWLNGDDIVFILRTVLIALVAWLCGLIVWRRSATQ